MYVLLPDFSAAKLKMSISADVDNSDNFATSLKTPDNACSLLYCPLQADERRIFDVYLMLDKSATVSI